METTETVLDVDKYPVSNVLFNECDALVNTRGNYWLGVTRETNRGFVLKLSCCCSFTEFMLRNTFNTADRADRLVP